MKKILVLTDFSDQAENALHVATQIAQKNEGAIFLLHVIPVIAPVELISSKSSVEASIEEKYMEYVRESAQDRLKKLQGKYTSTAMQTIISEGDLFKVTRQFLEENEVDLIVMGTTGASGLDEVLVGSNTEKIVRHSKAPVLSLRREVEDFQLKKIVFATTLKEDQVEALKVVQKVQNLFDASLDLLFINTPYYFLETNEMEERAAKLAEQTDLKNYKVVAYSSVHEELGIQKYTDSIGADLVALATHQRKGISRYFWGSITEDAVNHMTRPILSIALKN